MSSESLPAASLQKHNGPLLVRLCNWVGEAVLSLPALCRLSEAGYELHLLGKGWAPALFEGTSWPVVVRSSSLNGTTERLRGLRRSLGYATPPPALLMTNSFSSALEARLGGFSPSGYASEGRSFLLRHAYRRPAPAHAAHSYWSLAGSFLGTEERFPTELGWEPSGTQKARALTLLDENGLAAGSFVVLCPFSGPDDRNNEKVWPSFAKLTQLLQSDGIKVVICPGPGEEAAAAGLFPGAISLPAVDLGVYGALFQHARSVVANDTGPGHLAAAAGARLTSIYGPRSVAAWTPIGPNVQLFHDKENWPTVDQVAAAVLASS